ncbi:MAG TPA: LamG-like jellyroll fold domain-containing protein, partial [Actinomycetes bacterium]|nr:LamG-like jellyroll fold domain-containing protein [Actinomycetes bacterium]
RGGEVACRVKGDRGSIALVSSVNGIARDRKWHTAVCARSGDRVELMVDGIRTGGVSPLGVVNNRAHLTIGNKYRRAWSDQFRGNVDEIVFARGRGAGAAVRLALRDR